MQCIVRSLAYIGDSNALVEISCALVLVARNFVVTTCDVVEVTGDRIKIPLK